MLTCFMIEIDLMWLMSLNASWMIVWPQPQWEVH